MNIQRCHSERLEHTEPTIHGGCAAQTDEHRSLSTLSQALHENAQSPGASIHGTPTRLCLVKADDLRRLDPPAASAAGSSRKDLLSISAWNLEAVELYRSVRSQDIDQPLAPICHGVSVQKHAVSGEDILEQG